MLKVGMFTDVISEDLEHALRVIKGLGLAYAEPRRMWGKNLIELSDSEVRRVKGLFDKSGIKVSQIAAPTFKCYLEGTGVREAFRVGSHMTHEQTFAEHQGILERSFELARVFGTRIVRIFGFWREGDLTDGILEEILRRFQVAVKRAEEENLILAVENEMNTGIATGAEAKRLLDRIPSKNVGLIWDPGNAYCKEPRPYPDGYDLIKDRMVCFHVKDTKRIDPKDEYTWRPQGEPGVDRDGTYTFVPIGEGEVDIRGQLKALDRDKFSGPVTLETHWEPKGGTVEEGTLKSFANMKSMLKDLGIAMA